MPDNSDPFTGPNPWSVFHGGDPSAPPTAQGYGHWGTGNGSFATDAQNNGQTGGGASSAAAGTSSAAATPGEGFVGEDDVMIGLDGQIFQRLRNGFRTVGWKPLGSINDPAAAAAAGGFDLHVMMSEIQRQSNTNAQQTWQAGLSGYQGLSNLQLQQMNNTNTGVLGAQKNAWDLGQSDYAPGQTRQQASLGLGQLKDQYQQGETQYGLTNQVAAHHLEDLQRNLGTQQTTFNLAHEAQRQQNEGFKMNQTGYEQQKGAADRDLTGYGYQAMMQPQRLVGQ